MAHLTYAGSLSAQKPPQGSNLERLWRSRAHSKLLLTWKIPRIQNPASSMIESAKVALRAAPLHKLLLQRRSLWEGAHRRANVTLALSIINALRGILYLWRFFHVRSNLECAGCAIVVLGSILVGAFALIDRRRSNVPWYDDIYDDPVACAHLYKEQLKRADSLWNNFPLFLCWLFCMFGTWLYDRDPSYASLEASICYWFIVGTALLLILPSTLQMKHNNLRRIEEVDALLVERPSD